MLTEAERAERAEISRKTLRAKEARKKARWRLLNPEKAREKDRARKKRRRERTKPQREAAALARRIERIAKDAEAKEARRQASEERKAERQAAKPSPEQQEELRVIKNRKALARYHELKKTNPNFVAEENARRLRNCYASIDHYRAKKRERNRRYRERHPERKHENYKQRSAAYKFLKDQGVLPKHGPLDVPLAMRREAALTYIRETYPELGF